MISKVELHNWKTHSHSTFEFGNGTNVLIGPMGAGKTAVMDAICFALFGTFPALQARRIAVEEVIRNKPNKTESAEVRLHFDYAGKQFAVERVIKKRGSSEAKLYRDGKVVAGPKPTDVNKAIERTLEINYNLFSRAVYSEQNEIDFFLRLGPNERKQRFDELLDLKRYETVRANAVSVANRLKSIAKDRRVLLAEQKAGMKPGEEEALRKRIEEKEKENAVLLKKILEKEKKIQEMRNEIVEFEKKEKECKSLQGLLAKASGKAEELKEAIKEITREAKGRSLLELQREKKALEEEVKKTEKKLLELAEEKEKAIATTNEAEKTLAANERKLRELQQHMLQLKGLKATCPICKRKLEEKAREELVAENALEQKKIYVENEVLEKKAHEAKRKALVAEEEIVKARTKKEQCREREIELLHLEKKIITLEEKEKQLKELGEEITRLEKEVEKNGFDEKSLVEKRKALEAEKETIAVAKRSISANEEMVEELRQRLAQAKKTMEQIQQLEEKARRAEQGAEKMGYFVNSLLSAQAQLRSALVETVNQAMDSTWRMLYPYGDFISAKMDVEEGSYELKVKARDGEWIRVEGILSGGERSAAAICIRIAFSLVLTQNLGWIILDEPTHNLDNKAISALSEMMQHSLPGMVDQVFVITHDDQMKKAATASLYLLERDKDNDGTTKPVKLPLEY